MTFRLIYPLLASLLLIACNQDDSPTAAQRDGELALKPFTVVDFTGQLVSLERPAQRIVALSPHLVENAFSAGAGDAVIGVMEYSNFPPQAALLPRVGGFQKVNHELIVELQPDLILAWETGNSLASLNLLRELGFNIYVDQADSMEDVAKTIRDIGILSGKATLANQVADDYLAQIQAYKNNYRNAVKVPTFYQVWNDPLQTISSNHVISDALETCGGINIYANEIGIAPIVNIESILDRNPLAIIAGSESDAPPPWLQEWQQWPSISAVKHNNLFYVNPDHIQRHTVRLLQGIQSVCEKLDLARTRARP